ncbi:MAG: AsmA family protein [Candidatus Margulisbacteria bacterium]|nr:AsmA family protein [Candidatus Margulisiibacteriota bacterium]MBU1022255.1 AsmA family protein [Candidatus Margulisiibacteriota bacterium]MBU1729306.1 AsmA family protein [Candidatus Margulisiibacteriota bacterium]MBU1955579.1 AsmA family protein [Candidatus Margulisiibacteriota bacterium]
MKRFLKISIIILVAAIIWGALWYILDFIVIPRFVIPQIMSYVEQSNQKSPVKIFIKDLSFHPFKGFLLEEVKLAGPGESLIFQAKLADIDLNFIPLLWKHVEIKSINIDGADLNIIRNRYGKWNFAPLLGFSAVEGDQAGAFGFEVKRISFNDSRIFFADRFKQGNTLQRTFRNIDLDIDNLAGQKYRVKFSGKDKDNETISFKLDFDAESGAVTGSLAFDTQQLKEYWNYYLDDIFYPWRLSAQRLSGNADFYFAKEIFGIKGNYEVDQGSLEHGDFSFTGSADITQQQQFRNQKLVKDSTRIDVEISNLAAYAGKIKIFEQGKSSVLISDQEVTLTRLTAVNAEQKADLKGKFTFAPSRVLNLSGKIGDVDNDLKMSLVGNNRGVLYWYAHADSSYFKINANLTDIKNLAFQSDIEGKLKFTGQGGGFHLDLGTTREATFKVNKDSFNGNLNFRGRLTGEIDKPKSLSGRMMLNFRNFSFAKLQPRDFDLRMKVNAGEFAAEIPRTEFYKGTLYGAIVMDFSRWGAELDIDKCDIATLGKTDERFAGMKGTFVGNIACVGEWGKVSTLNGGGYFDLSDSDLSRAPIFKETEKGIGKHVKDFKLPNFKKIEGNFNISDEKVTIENALCNASNLNINIVGSITFTGDTDLTLGVKLFKGGWWQIFVPITFGLDILSDSLKLKVTGIWPNLSQTNEVQPLSWFQKLLDGGSQFDPNRYTLKKLWND